MTDNELLAISRQGDRSAFALLYIRHERPAWRFAYSLLRNETDAHDVVAETFMRVLRAIEHGNGPKDGAFGAYLFSSVRHECGRIAKERARFSDFEAPEITVEDYDVAEADALWAAFGSLPAHQRKVLTLTVVEDRPIHEVAEHLEITPNHASVQAMRARHALAGAYTAMAV